MNWKLGLIAVGASFVVAYAFAELTTPKPLAKCHTSVYDNRFDPFKEFLPGPDENRTIRI